MNHRSRPAACLLSLCLTTAAASACADSKIVASKNSSIRIGAGTAVSDFTSMARALAKTLGSQPPRYDVQIVVTDGGISSLESVQRGDSDCGFSYANVAYEAYAGRLSNDPEPLRRLRGVALVQISPLYFLTRKGLNIKSVSDLRGHSLAYGTSGSASSRAGMLVLNAFGLDVAAVRLRDEAFSASFRELKDGRLDAILFVAAEPSMAVTNALHAGAKLLPLEGQTVDSLRERYPFLHPLLIRADTYTGQHQPVRTVGVESLLLCREDVPLEDVRRVTEGWMVTFAQLVREGQLAEGVTADLASATPIPLHPGAAAYYRSRQVSQR
jgi:TRAP transporter TAXI family solute receptor